MTGGPASLWAALFAGLLAPPPYAEPAPAAEPAPQASAPPAAAVVPPPAPPLPAPCLCQLPTVDSPTPLPAGYRVESHARRGLVIAGSVVVGVGMLAPIIVTAGKSAPTPNYTFSYEPSTQVPFEPSLLYVPVLGPWAALLDTRDD